MKLAALALTFAAASVSSAATIIQVREINLPIGSTLNTSSAATRSGTMFFDQIDPSQYRIDSLVLGIDSVTGGTGLALNLTSNPINYTQLAVVTNRLTSPGGTGSPAVSSTWIQGVAVPGFFGSTNFVLSQRNLTGPVVPIASTEFFHFEGTGQVAVQALSSLTASTLGQGGLAGTIDFTTNRIKGTLIATVTPVPEPASTFGLIFGLAATVGPAWRRRKKAMHGNA